ncbi:MAG: hypothetical protein M3211_04050 [Actinomycetota bacterium]|nr:hypothetical protein [Actinomycetota bacterium]
MPQPPSEGPRTPPRVFVHVGAPKTGTTFLQNVLWTNRDALAEDGVLYPYARPHEHFAAMLDLRERAWGAKPAGHWRGTWDAVASRAASWTGHTVVLGNEVLGGANERQIRRLVDSLAPAEVHVLFTARDLARQLVSDWQEHLKHKHTITLEDFVDELVEHGLDARPPFGEMFWGLHDAAHVLSRWARVVPADRVHVVTLPPPGGPRDALWQRFCQVTGLDPTRYSLDVRRANPSLGRSEAELVRRLNKRVGDLPTPHYDFLVRQRLGGGPLHGSGGRIVLPEGRMPWVLERSRALVDQLAAAGYDVVGDLDDLLPRPQDHEGYVPTRAVRAKAILPAAVRTNVTLLRLAARQRAKIRALRAELGRLPPEQAQPEPGLRDHARRALATARSRLRRR